MRPVDYIRFIGLIDNEERRLAQITENDPIETDYLVEHVRGGVRALLEEEGLLADEPPEKVVELMDDPRIDEFREIVFAARKAREEKAKKRAAEREQASGNDPDELSNPTRRRAVDGANSGEDSAIDTGSGQDLEAEIDAVQVPATVYGGDDDAVEPGDGEGRDSGESESDEESDGDEGEGGWKKEIGMAEGDDDMDDYDDDDGDDGW